MDEGGRLRKVDRQVPRQWPALMVQRSGGFLSRLRRVEDKKNLACFFSACKRKRTMFAWISTAMREAYMKITYPPSENM